VQKKVKHMTQKILLKNANEAEETSVQSNDRNNYAEQEEGCCKRKLE